MSLDSIYQTRGDITNPNLKSVMAKLATFNPEQLKAFAAANQDDMILLGAAQAVHANHEKFAQAKMAQQGGQMPPVNQQVVQNIGPTPPQGMPPQGMPPQGGQGMPPQGMPSQGMPPQGGGPLPEQQGIAQLPAPNIQNMAGGGIVAFADGGYADEDMAESSTPVMRFADRGLVGGFEAQIREEALRQGVDPDLAVRLFMTESAGKKDAVSPKGAAGLGQLMIPAAKEMGLSPADRFDPNKNIPASVGYLKKQMNKYGGDPEKALAAYNWGPGNVDKHLAKNEGQLNRVGLPKETADYLTKILPMGTAVAAQTKNPDLASQIPGYSPARSLAPGEKYDVPASNYDEKNSYFGQLADKMGIPLEYQRNINNTLNAMGGWASPVTRVNRAVGMASKGLEATPEMVAKAQQAKQVAETPRLLPPAKAGLEALDAASQETRAAAEAARRARLLQQDQQAARAAEQSVNAANATSKIARTTEEGIAAIPNAQAMNAAKATNAARTLSATQFAEQQLGGQNAAAPRLGMEPVRPDEFGMPEEEKKAIIAAAKEVTPAKERKGFDAEDWLTLGLGLMANKSPRFLTAFGEEGLKTLASKKEREKGATDKLYKEALISQATRPAADVQMIEKYASDPKFREAYDQFVQAKREPITRESLAKTWSSNFLLQQQYPNFEDYFKMAASAVGGGASGTQLSAADQSLVQKYLR
jgi:hypothetical protein